jgi:hypothetical protein
MLIFTTQIVDNDIVSNYQEDQPSKSTNNLLFH